MTSASIASAHASAAAIPTAVSASDVRHARRQTSGPGCTAAHRTPARTRGAGGALRAVKVFTGTALGVLLLGSHGEDAEAAGVRRR